MSFRKQVTSSAAWVGLSTAIIKVLSFITITLVLAQVLNPSDFGLVGMAWLAINAFDFLRELGVTAALVYRQGEDEDVAADVAYIALAVTSVIIYILVFTTAPYIERFFSDSQGLTQILRVLALTMLINAVGQVPYTLMAKNLDFRNKAVPEIMAGVSNSIVAITLALTGFGVWALVGGYITDSILRNSLVWLFTTWRPRWRFQRTIWREMFDYGKHVVSSRVLIFGITNIDDAMIGRVLGSSALGFYTLAYRLSNLPATHMTKLVSNVMFPAFSKIQKDRERIRRIFFQTIHAIGLLAAPISIATIVLGPTFVHEYYLGRWDEAIVAMQWLTVYGFARAIAANMGPIMRAMGKPQWLSTLALWRFTTMVLFLYPAILWKGIVGVSILSAVVAVVDFGIAAWITNRLIGGGYTPYARMLGPALAAAALSASIAWLTLPYWPSPHRLLPFLLSGVLMMALYAGVMWRADSLFRQLSLSALHRLLSY
ncbi:MAG TPA: lipopolysaccharide biosynthesis protein [Caldilineae bacterium]|nr:lipopolysaccharide biosynthesis protein [Caldilineae bacterium]HIQ12367.1 lipopolysaccharide biosynthesis protein [Caldilineales bacterium]